MAMVDFTLPEIEKNLWALHCIDLAYSHEPPEGSVLDSVKSKLLEEAQQLRDHCLTGSATAAAP